MKELSIEEKARAYDEAIKRARYWEKNPTVWSSDDICQKLFPELVESEDEKIRKEIIAFLTYYHTGQGNSVKYNDGWIAWLEKQGEQKPVDEAEPKFRIGDKIRFFRKGTTNEEPMTITKIDEKGYWSDNLFICNFIDADRRLKLVEQKPTNKIEPKFKVRDWIVNNNSGGVYQVTEIRDDEYCLWPLNADKMGYLRIIDIDNEYHVWTIQDAKDGDILMANAPFIFNGNLEGGMGCPGAHCGINTLGEFQIPEYPKHWTGHTTTPATKEQCELLFQKMHEAGYEWDDEKKEPKKIEQKSADWSEEDEKHLSWLVEHLNQSGELYSNLIDWLKSIKDRYTWKPSNEQIVALQWVLNNIPYNKHKEEISGLLDQIKEL